MELIKSTKLLLLLAVVLTSALGAYDTTYAFLMAAEDKGARTERLKRRKIEQVKNLQREEKELQEQNTELKKDLELEQTGKLPKRGFFAKIFNHGTRVEQLKKNCDNLAKVKDNLEKARKELGQIDTSKEKRKSGVEVAKEKVAEETAEKGHVRDESVAQTCTTPEKPCYKNQKVIIPVGFVVVGVVAVGVYLYFRYDAYKRSANTTTPL